MRWRSSGPTNSISTRPFSPSARIETRAWKRRSSMSMRSRVFGSASAVAGGCLLAGFVRALGPAVFTAPTTPSDSLREMWDLVTTELDALDTEIASLHSEIEGRAVPYSMRARLNEIEQSARALFEKEREIRSLLDLWQGRTPNTVDARESEESGDETR